MVFFAASLVASGTVFGQEYYENGRYRIIRSNPNVPLIAKLNVWDLVKKHASDFQMGPGYISEGWSAVRYGMSRNDGQQIMLKVGLHPSVREAEEAMLDAMLEQINIPMTEWPAGEEKIGESSWFFTSSKSEQRKGVAFIRRNAVVYIYVHDWSKDFDVVSLAKAIDQDLVNGAPYVTIQDKISPPIVQSIDLSQSVFRMGEKGTITIHGTDPEGHRIINYGNSWIGFGLSENQTTVYADNRNWYDKDSFYGTHVIKCWVVNENNLFSSIKEVTITF